MIQTLIAALILFAEGIMAGIMSGKSKDSKRGDLDMRDQRRCRRCGRVAVIAYPKIHCDGCKNALFLPQCAPSGIPLTIVCGPSGSGKSTWVEHHATGRDIVIDVDRIKAELNGLPVFADLNFSEAAFLRRNDMLANLARAGVPRWEGDIVPEQAYFIVQAPTASERDHWRRTLLPKRMIVLETPFVDCMDRIIKDPRRHGQYDTWVNVAQMWWNKYEKDSRDEVHADNNKVAKTEI